jgi:uncharacterized protein YbaP (TraB family)
VGLTLVRKSPIRNRWATRLIEKSLRQAAERSGLTVQELEDMSVRTYELDALGRAEMQIADAKATVQLREDGRVATIWQNAEGKPMICR